ncbi:NADPH-dependent aldehyde reductase-like protein,chloroplastic [Trichinella pseudospiralis]
MLAFISTWPSSDKDSAKPSSSSTYSSISVPCQPLTSIFSALCSCFYAPLNCMLSIVGKADAAFLSCSKWSVE